MWGRGSCGDGRPRPSKPSEARQSLHPGQLSFSHHDPGRLARARFLADHDPDIAIQSIKKMHQPLDGGQVAIFLASMLQTGASRRSIPNLRWHSA